MEIIDLNTVARILNADVERLKKLPKEVQENMIVCVEMLGDDLENAENFKEVYWEVQNIWSRAINDMQLEEVSLGTGIPMKTLMALPYEIKQQINFEYGVESGNIQNIENIITAYYNKASLDEISKLMNVPTEKLRELNLEQQEQISGIYEMETGLEYDIEEVKRDIIDYLESEGAAIE